MSTHGSTYLDNSDEGYQLLPDEEIVKQVIQADDAEVTEEEVTEEEDEDESEEIKMYPALEK